MTKKSFMTGIMERQIESACASNLSLQTRIKQVQIGPCAGVSDLDDQVDCMNIPSEIKQELLRHLSNFVSDLDKIGGIIEEAKPHHAIIRYWRKLKFEMEGDLNDALQIINNREASRVTALNSRSMRRP